MSQSRTSTPNSASHCAFDRSRTNPRTSIPEPTSRSAKWPPRKPEAPVTNAERISDIDELLAKVPEAYSMLLISPMFLTAHDPGNVGIGSDSLNRYRNAFTPKCFTLHGRARPDRERTETSVVRTNCRDMCSQS